MALQYNRSFNLPDFGDSFVPLLFQREDVLAEGFMASNSNHIFFLTTDENSKAQIKAISHAGVLDTAIDISLPYLDGTGDKYHCAITASETTIFSLQFDSTDDVYTLTPYNITDGVGGTSITFQDSEEIRERNLENAAPWANCLFYERNDNSIGWIQTTIPPGGGGGINATASRMNLQGDRLGSVIDLPNDIALSVQATVAARVGNTIYIGYNRAAKTNTINGFSTAFSEAVSESIIFGDNEVADSGGVSIGGMADLGQTALAVFDRKATVQTSRILIFGETQTPDAERVISHKQYDRLDDFEQRFDIVSIKSGGLDQVKILDAPGVNQSALDPLFISQELDIDALENKLTIVLKYTNSTIKVGDAIFIHSGQSPSSLPSQYWTIQAKSEAGNFRKQILICERVIV